MGYPHLAYSVTKAANTQFIRMIAQQYAGQGIRANTVVPGLIDTPRIANTVAKMFSENGLDEARAARDKQVPMGRIPATDEMAMIFPVPREAISGKTSWAASRRLRTFTL
jgi:NAD(P)-dependent dehydrogenase (short-subunit alcohol dehydrogenase family)